MNKGKGMLIEILKTNSSRATKRFTVESLLPFNFPELFEKVKLKRTLMSGELYSKILVNRPDKKIVLTAIHKDTVIDSFQSDDSVTFQVIDGKLELHTRKELVILNEGQLLTLNENINYNLSTREKTMFLLTIVSEGMRQKSE